MTLLFVSLFVSTCLALLAVVLNDDDRFGMAGNMYGTATSYVVERDSNIVAESAFGAVTARLWSLLRGESLKAIGAKGV